MSASRLGRNWGVAGWCKAGCSLEAEFVSEIDTRAVIFPAE